MTKKKCRAGVLILVGVLVIFGVLGIALGSHHISYYEMQPNPLHNLKAKDPAKYRRMLNIVMGNSEE